MTIELVGQQVALEQDLLLHQLGLYQFLLLLEVYQLCEDEFQRQDSKVVLLH